MKEFVTERIVNVFEIEKKIKEARLLSDNLLKSLNSEDYLKAEYLASNLSLKLHELDNFEFVIEQRKIKITSESNH